MTLGPQTRETLQPAPAWEVARWFNADAPLSPEALKGQVIVLGAFQLLCPGCVSHGVPQLARAAATFDPADVAVVGLHTVFEHHDAQGPATLEAFLHEYRVTFPVGVDAPSKSAAPPRTFTAYGLEGTPSLVLIDRAGRLRARTFGRADDMAFGAAVAGLIAESGVTAGSNAGAETDRIAAATPAGDCKDGSCAL